MKYIFLIAATIFFCAPNVFAQETAATKTWYDKQTKWHDFDQFHFQHSGSNCYLIIPAKPLPNNPWIWRARFPGYHAEMDVELIRRGYHLAYFDVAGKFGSPESIERATKFYRYLVDEHQLSATPVLEGVSRGGLFVYNWVAKNPDKVSCIYCDTPVCDLRSWPGGHGAGIGSAPTWKQCLAVYSMTPAQMETYQGMPIHHAKIIAEHKIPILHIVSENDRVVPPNENTYVLQAALKKHGHDMQIISVPMGTEKSNGHHFTHPEPQEVINFIIRNTK